jgi:phosphomannomutase
MVTGSQMPEDRNGTKLYCPEGEILQEDEPGIRDQVLAGQAWGDAGSPPRLAALPAPIAAARADYVSRYIDLFGQGTLRGMRVGVYQHSAVSLNILAEIFGGLGAEVAPIGCSETLTPVDTEAIRPVDAALARQLAAEHALRAIASTDGDSDRPIVADKKGEWLRSEVLVMLCARELGMKIVVTQVSSKSMVESCGIFERIVRTSIGSPHVIKAMNAAPAEGDAKVCGYEANSGFLLGSGLERGGVGLSALPTPDAVLSIFSVLLASEAASISGSVDGLPRVFALNNRNSNFAVARPDALMNWMLQDKARDGRLGAVFAPIAGAELTRVDVTDGVWMTLGNGRVIHLRASGNAPPMRRYAEAKCSGVARKFGAMSLAFVADDC